MPHIDTAIQSYLTAFEVEGNPKAVASYANSLADFRRVGRQRGLPESIEDYEVDHVYTFLGVLRERGASRGFQHGRHREVQTLFSWCHRMDHVETNVFKRVPRIRLGEQVKPPFTPDGVRALLESQDRSYAYGCRNYALILFLLDTGVRASECIAIDLDDVDWEQHRVLVRHAKGNKQRWVGLWDHKMRSVAI